jgi:GntR family transcriptional regulator/MocR family aminotransferase
MKHPSGAFLPNLEGSFEAGSPLHLQIYRRIRGAILGGTLPPGSRLPSTRTLAADLDVSRNTAEEAFSQLEAEGFLVRRVGDGTYVALPDSPARPAAPRPGQSPVRSPGTRSLSARGRAITVADACPEPTVPRAFAAGLPALEAFPFDTWSRLLTRRLRRSGRDLLGYGDPAGYGPLREAVAAYLGMARGVACDARQVIILTSSQQALDLTARLLEAGFQATLHLPAGTDDVAVARRAASHGVEVQPLSRFYAGDETTPGLVLGFAGLAPEAIREGMRRLAEVL